MTKTTLKIEGMMCPMCETHINEVIRRTIPTAKKVSSSFKRREASFLTDDEVDENRLKEAIAATGYTCTSIASELYEKKGWFKR